MKPKRIQRRREKGWRTPADSLYVGRPGKWANPFRVMGRNEYLFCDASHRRHITDRWVIFDPDQDIRRNRASADMAVQHYARWILGEFEGTDIVRPCPFTVAQITAELGGVDLVCWCAPGEPCHADVLLAIANSSIRRPSTA